MSLNLSHSQIEAINSFLEKEIDMLEKEESSSPVSSTTSKQGLSSSKKAQTPEPVSERQECLSHEDFTPEKSSKKSIDIEIEKLRSSNGKSATLSPNSINLTQIQDKISMLEKKLFGANPRLMKKEEKKKTEGEERHSKVMEENKRFTELFDNEVLRKKLGSINSSSASNLQEASGSSQKEQANNLEKSRGALKEKNFLNDESDGESSERNEPKKLEFKTDSGIYKRKKEQEKEKEEAKLKENEKEPSNRTVNSCFERPKAEKKEEKSTKNPPLFSKDTKTLLNQNQKAPPSPYQSSKLKNSVDIKKYGSIQSRNSQIPQSKREQPEPNRRSLVEQESNSSLRSKNSISLERKPSGNARLVGSASSSRSNSPGNYREKNIQSPVSNKKVLEAEKKNRELARQLMEERARIMELSLENQSLTTKLKKSEVQMSRFKALEEDYQRLLLSFEKSEVIRTQQKNLIGSLQEQISILSKGNQENKEQINKQKIIERSGREKPGLSCTVVSGKTNPNQRTSSLNKRPQRKK